VVRKEVGRWETRVGSVGINMTPISWSILVWLFNKIKCSLKSINNSKAYKGNPYHTMRIFLFNKFKENDTIHLSCQPMRISLSLDSCKLHPYPFLPPFAIALTQVSPSKPRIPTGLSLLIKYIYHPTWIRNDLSF
jgi:hypothetical protein